MPISIVLSKVKTSASPVGKHSSLF